MPKLDVVMVPIGELHEDVQNLRQHPTPNIDAIKGSLSRFGQQKAIVACKDGTIVAGNGTFRAAVALGWKEIAVHYTSLRPDEAKAYGIADNRTAEMAEWDDDALAASLAQMKADALDLFEATGFDDVTLEKMAPDYNTVATPVLKSAWEIIIECDGEKQQQSYYEKLTREGYRCRLLTL